MLSFYSNKSFPGTCMANAVSKDSKWTWKVLLFNEKNWWCCHVLDGHVYLTFIEGVSSVRNISSIGKSSQCRTFAFLFCLVKHSAYLIDITREKTDKLIREWLVITYTEKKPWLNSVHSNAYMCMIKELDCWSEDWGFEPWCHQDTTFEPSDEALNPTCSMLSTSTPHKGGKKMQITKQSFKALNKIQPSTLTEAEDRTQLIGILWQPHYHCPIALFYQAHVTQVCLLIYIFMLIILSRLKMLLLQVYTTRSLSLV